MKKTWCKYILILFIIFLYSHAISVAQSFVHPGLLHAKEDLERIKKAVAKREEPIYSGYLLFVQNPASQHTYQVQGPLAMVGRNPTVGQGTYDSDANAAHQNAVMWYITGDKAYANKAISILNAWSSTLKSITGRDAVLMAGLGPFKMVNAAEIIRYTNAGWSEADIQKTGQHFRNVIYPVIKDFAPFANGNWDAAAIKTVMAIGVFCNDRPMFESALRYYVNGRGNGRLTNYVINEAGQIQESGRDQGHTQLGIGMLAECSEIAWHQGLNLYGYANNRLLKGFEYVASFNLGNEVPFVETLDRTGKYHHTTIARQDRGPLRAVYEQVLYHYVNRMGLDAPFIKQAAEKIRPEGPGRPGADHPGYGTLFYTKPVQSLAALPLAPPAAPGAIIATASQKKIALSWVESVGATAYTVRRATEAGGPYTTLATNIKGGNYIDQQLKPGVIYHYTVTATNARGESKAAYATTVTAGLPAPWKQQDVGSVQVAGTAMFDGVQLKMEGSGMGVDSTTDEFHFAYYRLKGDGEIIARFVRQPSSQFSKMGLMMREALSPVAPHVSLMIYPGKTGQVEAPAWHVRLLKRIAAGDTSGIAAVGATLVDPAVTWGRLTGHLWLRLSRQGNTFTGATSYDGSTWTSVGSTKIDLNKTMFVGLPISSGIPNVSTTIVFDKVGGSVKLGK